MNLQMVVMMLTPDEQTLLRIVADAVVHQEILQTQAPGFEADAENLYRKIIDASEAAMNMEVRRKDETQYDLYRDDWE